MQQYVECLRANQTSLMPETVVRPVQTLPGAKAHELSEAMMGRFNVIEASATITVKAFPRIPAGAEFEFLNKSAAGTVEFRADADATVLSIESRPKLLPGGGCAALKYLGFHDPTKKHQFALIGALIK